MSAHGLFLALNALVMMVLPFALGHWLSVRKRLNWGLFFIGAATFVLSQVGHIPFNNWFLNQFPAVAQSLPPLALFAGLSAGLFEEVARYVTMRYWAREARTWADGMLLGLGHGGIESIILGLLAAINGYVILNAEGSLARSIVPAEQVPILANILESMLADPPYLLLMGAGERLLAIAMHLAVSLMVLRSVTTRRLRWVLLAIMAHALFDATAVYVAGRWGALWTEAVLAGLALVCLGLILAWRPGREPEGPNTEAQQPALPVRRHVEREAPTREQLDRSRYN